MVAFTETATVQHDHSDGNSYAITFYRLADGRGWTHDFHPDKPGQPACTVIVSGLPFSLNFSSKITIPTFQMPPSVLW